MQTVKMVVTGPFSAGKTEFIQSVSEIDVVATERKISNAAERSVKEATTVAMDFGRVSLDDDLILYLFGTPGQQRFWFMWDDLIRGAIGAVVLIDTRRLADSFAAIDYFENRGLPFVVGYNLFDGVRSHELEQVREALALRTEVPIVTCDARDRASTKATLITLVEHVLGLVASARN